MSENEKAIVAAQKVLDEFMEAFNARDVEAFEATFNFPSVRLASGKLILIDKGFHTPSMFTTGALADWDHSAWERRNVLHVGPDKVHIDTRFSRYRKDGSVIGGFDSIYVVTSENGHWGVKIRSSVTGLRVSSPSLCSSPSPVSCFCPQSARGRCIMGSDKDRLANLETRSHQGCCYRMCGLT